MAMIMKRLNIISRQQAIFRQRLGEKQGLSELTPAQHTLILAICRLPGRSQEEIAREMCINKSTVTRAVSALVDAGYVTRIPNDEDKRELLIYPTKKMLLALPTVKDITRRWAEIITAGISDAELSTFEGLLEKMEKNAREALGEGIE